MPQEPVVWVVQEALKLKGRAGSEFENLVFYFVFWWFILSHFMRQKGRKLFDPDTYGVG